MVPLFEVAVYMDGVAAGVVDARVAVNKSRKQVQVESSRFSAAQEYSQ